MAQQIEVRREAWAAEEGAHEPERRLYVAGKRAFDLAFGAALLGAASPVWLVAALLVRLTSPGPVIFRQARCGRGGTVFTCWKFRTMRDGADRLLEEDDEYRRRFADRWKLENDPRLSPVGRWLRKSSVDELPQLWNVLRGEMSIVGPRAVQPRELAERIGVHAPVFTSVKPGLTGLWQVSGRSRLSYEERIALDLEYIRRRGFWFDMLIVLRTVPAVITGHGAI